MGHEANPPRARPATLYGAAMSVGRDHVASAVDTLVPAGIVASVPITTVVAAVVVR